MNGEGIEVGLGELEKRIRDIEKQFERDTNSERKQEPAIEKPTINQPEPIRTIKRHKISNEGIRGRTKQQQIRFKANRGAPKTRQTQAKKTK